VNRLKLIRERKSLTLAQLSARTSIPLRLLSDYESNIQEISPAHVKALSKALWIKPEELVPAEIAAPAPAGADGAASAVRPPLPGGSPAPNPLPEAPLNGGLPPAAGAPAPAIGGPAPGYGAPRPYAPAYGAPRPDGLRPPRPAGPLAGGDLGRGPRPPSRGRREPVVMPATDGQITEIMRLAARLNLSTEELESQFGRGIDNITRFDAREWIKKLREDALAKAPPAKVHFGQWPGLRDDREAVYLAEQRELRAPFRVVLFNGQVFHGRVADFTPYTITIEEDTPGGAEQIVLRKLAVAYYQRTGTGGGPAAAAPPAGEAKDIAPFAGPGAPAFVAPGAAPTDASAVAEPAPAAKAPRARAVKAKAAPAASDSGAASGSEGAPSAAAGGEEPTV